MNESQFINITTLCDGYTEVEESRLDDYKQTYFYVVRDEKILFPFIYLKSYILEGYPEKTIINIRKNQYIEIKEGKKITSSL